ncbi:Asx homology domain-containing protein [Cladorrhinum sp. PSN259]|nr:Asx homology domain-containing protein [Cladorrhinum sp. PSN259]
MTAGQDNKSRPPSRSSSSGLSDPPPSNKEEVVKSAPLPKKGKVVPSVSKRKKRWTGPFVWADSKSPLKKPEFLRKMLLNPRAWEILTPEAKKRILEKLPNNKHIMDLDTDDARPNATTLRNDNNFSHDCARYIEKLEWGHHDPEWLRQAWIAHKKHIRGDFDKFQEEKFKEEWDTELPTENQPAEGSIQSTEGAQDSEAQD